jgi:hypothetical protein
MAQKIEPTYFKSKEWKKLEEEFSKPPKVEITARSQTKEEKKKAKMLEKVINYSFETNANGIINKYMQVMRLCRDNFLQEQVYGIQVNWDTTNKLIENIAKEPKKYADFIDHLNKEGKGGE